MTSLVTADGRLLKRSRPAGIDAFGGLGGINAPLWTNGERLGDSDTGKLVSFEDIYESQPVVAAAVNKLTRQGSTLPLKVYRKGANNERERVIDHPLEQLLRMPCPRRGPVHLKQWALWPLLVHGNSLLAKFREEPDAPPSYLLPVDWRHVEAYAPQGGPIEWWATTQTGERRYIAVEDTVHFAWHSTTEVGVSPLKQLGVTIRLEDAAQRYQTANFRNGVRPSSAVTAPDSVNLRDPDVRTFFRDQVEKMHKGADRAGKMFLLSPGADIKPLAFSAVEAELIQQRKLDREEVAMVYDLPGPLIGDLEHGTYSNVEELHKQLYKSVLRPWLTMIEETVQAHLIDPEPSWQGMFVEFDLAEQLKGDPLELAQAIKTQIDAGVLTRNEGRKLLNLPRDENEQADQLFFAANNQAPIGTAGVEGETVEPTEPPQLP